MTVVSMRLAWLLALCSAAMVAAAAPEDDYKQGQLAYQRGDVVGAMAALRPAARAGHAPSQALLAFFLDHSDFIEEAAALYRDAAAQGNADGHAGLANLYMAGRGIAKDEKLAFMHFSKAADLGHGSAIEYVASVWLKGQLGRNAATDPEGARAALQRAAALDHLPSIEALAKAYQSGGYGLTADAAEAKRWQARLQELRKQRAAKPAPKASS